MRMKRSTYSVIYVLSTIILGFLSNMVALQGSQGGAMFLFLILVAIHLYIAVGRFKDMDKSPWLSLLTLLPFVSFILMFPKGTEGDNQYGSAP